jgi:hypothetical protein
VALDRVWSFIVLAGIVLPGAFYGCSRQAPPLTQQAVHLKDLAVAYGRFIPRHRGQTPANEQEFREFVQQIREELPSKPTDVNSLFVSPRDNQPYVIRYGIPSTMGGPQAPVIAYEQQGVGGKRYVANMLGAVEEVDEARFRELVPDAE